MEDIYHFMPHSKQTHVVRPWTDGHCNLCLSDKQDLPIGAIAGGAVAAAAVVVVVVVVVVIVVRRKRRKHHINTGKGEDADTTDGKTCLICLCLPGSVYPLACRLSAHFCLSVLFLSLIHI